MNKHHYIHPRSNALSWFIAALCNSVIIKKVRRRIFAVLPPLKMKSDVKDIVYINWLVDREVASKFNPANVSLIDINGKTLLSVLTYQHGNLRPAAFNIIRALFPSPLQSNWRFYVSSLQNKETSNTVLFIKNIMSSTAFSINTRLFSDAMQTHLAKTFTHNVNNDKTKTVMTRGIGSAEDFECSTQVSDNFNLPKELSDHFGSDQQAIKYLCLQDFALSEGEDFNGVCKAEISLPIDVAQIIPLSVTAFDSHWLKAITGDAKPFAFLVPAVKFEVLNEVLV